jgi:hypothetical protein
MTLIGAINSNKKILFADRKWLFKGKGSKVFETRSGLFAVSGIVTKGLIDNIKKANSIADLIDSEYKKIECEGTSFIHYDKDRCKFFAYMHDGKDLYFTEVSEYIFFGYCAKEISEKFDPKNITHTLFYGIKKIKDKYPAIIGDYYDFFFFENNLSVHSLIHIK